MGRLAVVGRLAACRMRPKRAHLQQRALFCSFGDSSQWLGGSLQECWRVNRIDASLLFAINVALVPPARGLHAWMTGRLRGWKPKPLFDTLWQESGMPVECIWTRIDVSCACRNSE